MALPRAPLICARVDEVRPVPSGQPVDVKSYLGRVAPKLLRGGTRPVVLILTREWDPEADFVGTELFARGVDYVRLNVEDVGGGLLFSCFEPGSRGEVRLSVRGERVAAADIQVVFYRHFTPRRLAVSSPERSFADTFANEEWHAAFTILKQALPCIWINDYRSTREAFNRVRQLDAATECGFATPRTLITNNASDVVEFREAIGGPLVIKALHHHDVEYDQIRYSMFCRDFPSEDSGQLNSLVFAPAIVQEKIQRTLEARVTIVGDAVFTVELKAGASYDFAIQKTPLREIAKKVAHYSAQFDAQCRQLARTLGLSYAALDFVLNERREPVFLEVNPDGDWAWLEPQTGVPISAAMADLILSHLHD